jgi:hypothetical protein
MTTLYNILIAYIAGILSQLLILYLKSKYYEPISKSIFTEGISYETITYIVNYQKLLCSKLEAHDSFLITVDKKYNLILTNA